MRRLNIALIGAGRIGRSHANILATIPNVIVTAVCDSTLEAAATLARPFAARATVSVPEVLADPAVHAVLITTPTPMHASLVEEAARAGKAIFVEKPVADSLQSADRVVRAVQEAGVACQVGFQRRYDPAYQEVKRKIDAGELGRLEGFRGVGRDPAPPPLEFLKTSGGLMVDMGIHDLDSARFFLGEVAELYCTGGVLAAPELEEYGLFDTAVATLKFVSGAVGTVEVALRTAYGYDIRAEVLGEKGRLHIEMDSRFHLRQYGAQGVRYDRPANFEQRFQEAYANELRAFAEAVMNGHPVAPGPEDARESLRLALAAQYSLETGSIIKVQQFGKEVHA
jgi:scyllo-inositol 2-dehydrogenase (NAD+)